MEQSGLKSTSGIPAIPNKLILLYSIPTRPKFGTPLEAAPWKINGTSIPKRVLAGVLSAGKTPPDGAARCLEQPGKTWMGKPGWENMEKQGEGLKMQNGHT